MQVITKRTFEKGGFTYTVQRVLDEYPDLSYLEEGGPKYRERDAARLKALHDGEWCMVAVLVDIQKQTEKNWAVPPTVGSASLWGIESDSDESYFGELEQELIEEAEADVQCLIRALTEKGA